jgi:hypothetical protein
LAAIAVFAANCISLDAQRASSAQQSDPIAVSIAIEREHVQAGQSPKVLLTIKNLTDRPLQVIACLPIKIYLQGEKGEPPTTRLKRDFTGRLLPGEAPLMCNDMAATVIDPRGSYIESAQIKDFYDLSLLGKYTVYVEVPSRQMNDIVWLRTNTAEFEILASATAPHGEAP